MIQFHCYGCNEPVSSLLPNGALLRAIAWCPECIGAFKDQYITADDARRFGRLIEFETGYGNNADNAPLIERLRSFDATISATTPEVKAEVNRAK